MANMQELDKRMKDTEVAARKRYLIKELNKLGVNQSRDGRRLEDLRLYSLEWIHIEEKNKVAKAFGERR